MRENLNIFLSSAYSWDISTSLRILSTVIANVVVSLHCSLMLWFIDELVRIRIPKKKYTLPQESLPESLLCPYLKGLYLIPKLPGTGREFFRLTLQHASVHFISTSGSDHLSQRALKPLPPELVPSRDDSLPNVGHCSTLLPLIEEITRTGLYVFSIYLTQLAIAHLQGDCTTFIFTVWWVGWLIFTKA